MKLFKSYDKRYPEGTYDALITYDALSTCEALFNYDVLLIYDEFVIYDALFALSSSGILS